MYLFTACGCGLDPASETLLVQTGLAAVLSTPFWFRAQLVRAKHRLLSQDDRGDGCAVAVTGHGPPLARR